MSDDTVSIARVPLARAAWRLLAVPLLAVLLAAGAVAAAAALGGWAGAGLGLAGVATLVLAGWLGLILLSIRLDVEVSSIRFHWLGGERRYALVRGPVTRVALEGPKAVALHAWFGAFGWTIGRARLRGDERIEIVRLTRTGSLILVPTEGMRLAVAPRSEQDLITALTAAARVQQRLEAARPRLRLPVVPASVEALARAVPPSAERPEPFAPTEPRMLTGIERVQLEQRLAAQRAMALAVAEGERRAQERQTPAPSTAATAVPARRAAGRRPALQRPAWTRPAWARPAREDLAALGVLLVPAIATGIAWAASLLIGAPPGTSAPNLTLALVLIGPAATLGAVAARIWWPRLAPLVVASSLFALVLLASDMATRG